MQHRNKNKTKVSMNTLQKQYTPEQEAVIADWVSKFSKGRSVDFRRIKAEDGARWQVMAQSHNLSSVRAKVYYHRMKVTKDIEPKPSLNRKYARKGPYQCRKCDFTASSKQSMGSHYRFSHPKGEADNGVIPSRVAEGSGDTLEVWVPKELLNQFVIVSPDGTVRAAKLLKHCPECMEPLIALNVARNI